MLVYLADEQWMLNDIASVQQNEDLIYIIATRNDAKQYKKAHKIYK